MYKCSMARSCEPAVLTFFGHTNLIAFEIWPMFGGRGLQRYVQPRMRVPRESWLALNIHLHGFRRPATDDKQLPSR